MKLLAFAASLRSASYNKRLALIAADEARAQGAEVRLADFREFEMPLYDGDVEERGMPAGARALVSALEEADGLLLASPEYNFSIPGTLKNAIDWVSRAKPMPLRGKSALLLATSPGPVGGHRGLLHTRVVLESLGVYTLPDLFTLPSAKDAFEGEGLKDLKQRERLRKLVGDFLRFGAALARKQA